MHRVCRDYLDKFVAASHVGRIRLENIPFVQSSVPGHKVASAVLLSGNLSEGDSEDDNDLRVKCVAMVPEFDKIYCQRIGGPIRAPDTAVCCAPTPNTRDDGWNGLIKASRGMATKDLIGRWRVTREGFSTTWLLA